eukprot:jgi/Ulvmu1/7386/UM036_0046.1
MVPRVRTALAICLRTTARSVAVSLLCRLLSPVFQRFWDSALQGDSAAVCDILLHYSIPVNTRHRASDAHLVLQITSVRTTSPEVDERLRDVLAVLFNAGWSPCVRRRGTKASALHLLAQQAHGCCVRSRTELLVQMQLRAPPGTENLLAAEDWMGLTPEDLAAGHSQALRSQLHHGRIAAAEVLQLPG